LIGAGSYAVDVRIFILLRSHLVVGFLRPDRFPANLSVPGKTFPEKPGIAL
jgi:hypothetical protein